jgi:hypothetical protein
LCDVGLGDGAVRHRQIVGAKRLRELGHPSVDADDDALRAGVDS